MIPLESNIENTICPLYVLEELLKPQGFGLGSKRDDEKGYFVYKIDTIVFVIIPFYYVAGSLDYPGVTVRVEKPFLIVHENQKRYVGTGGEAIEEADQFQSAVFPNGVMPDRYLTIGKRLIQHVEHILLP